MDSNQPASAIGDTFAVWVPNYAAVFSGMSEWLDVVEMTVERTAQEGARVLLFPEYVSESWLGFCPPEHIKPITEPWQAEQAPQMMARLQSLAVERQMLIVAGTVILPDGTGKWLNRAMIFFPDGTSASQDKISMMPDERDMDGLMSGGGLHVFSWESHRFAVVICLDIQIPRLAAGLLEQGGVDFLLVPAMTSRRSGYNRVSSCAAARAVELHCPVLMADGVGTITARGEEETNTGGASLFIPCETRLDCEGRREVIGPFDRLDEREGRLCIFRNIPVATCKQDRLMGGCEAWHADNHNRQFEVIK